MLRWRRAGVAGRLLQGPRQRTNRVDKFRADIRMPSEGIKQQLENHRYWFYFAQSCCGGGGGGTATLSM
jgi:hypothetical protein